MTEVAEKAASSAPPALASDRGGALSFPVVAAIFTTLLVLGVALGLAIHRSYVGFARVAAYHVAPDATLVVRWDIEKVGLFEPTRRFLLPLFDEVHAPPGSPAAASAAPPSHQSPLKALLPSTGPVKATANGRRDRFAAESGALLTRDLREVVALFGPADGDWALVLGGSFPKVDLVAAAERTLAKEGWPWRRLDGERLVSPEGAAFGRAADGVLVLASSVARLDAALVVRPLDPDIRREGAGSFRVDLTKGGLPPGSRELVAGLGPCTAVSGEAKSGSPLELSLLFAFQPSAKPFFKPEDAVRGALERLLGSDFARLERLYGPIKFLPSPLVRADRGPELTTILVDDMALERAAKRAAEAVENAMASGPAQE